ncbi:unnamed protein product [Orchesella dallaii]|uniref:Uncharacterized protein n=1 Tax=Orchesella dallaii TaxID=48710 RepID=A0ABP1PRY1_9HEXA
MEKLNPTWKLPRTYGTIRNAKQFVKEINSFRILHNVFQHTYRMWFQPSQKANTMAISSLAIYGVIKLEGRQARIMGFAATFSILYLASLYRKLGLLYETSMKLRQEWQTSPSSSKWMRKFIHSIPDFRVDVADFYFIRKTTVVNVIYTVLNGTITLLLA